MTGGGRRRR
jgi:hypothetical protein